jgi:phosphoserine phosphatase RsbU/P
LNDQTPNQPLDLADAAPCGIVEFTESGAILRANQHLCHQLDYTADEIRSLKFDQILTVSSRIFHQTHFLPLLKLHGHAEEIFLTLRHKSESPIPMLANATLTRRDQRHGVIVCAFIAVPQRGKYEQEILAARRQAEDALHSNAELQTSRAELQKRLLELDANLGALERRNQELTRLGEIFSHDLREPARKISAFTNLIREENFTSLNDASKDALLRIDVACDRISHLLKTLQEFIWIDNDAETPVSVDLREILHGARLAVSGALEVVAGDLPVIHGLSAQLRVLFECLFRSAVARAIDGRVTVRVTACDVQHNSFRILPGKYNYSDFVQILVADDGASFGCSDCDSLFQLLRKLPEQIAHPDLAICRKIVDNHSGFISLRSPPGEAAVFTILLPSGPRRAAAKPIDPK